MKMGIEIFKDKESLCKKAFELKEMFAGKTIDKIFVGKYLFDVDYFEYDDRIGKKIFYSKDAVSDVNFDDDTDLILKIGEQYFYWNNKDVKNKDFFEITIDISKEIELEKFVDISSYFSKNIINKTVKDIYADEVELGFVLENDYKFVISRCGDCSLLIFEFPVTETFEIDYEKLRNEHYFEKYSELDKFICEIKSDLIGKKLEKIMCLGIIWSVDNKNGMGLEFDEPVDIQIGNTHINAHFDDDSEAILGLNLFNYNERSVFVYHGAYWRNMSYPFKNSVGQTVKDIIPTRYLTYNPEDEEAAKLFGDKYKKIKIILENGYVFEISNLYDYTVLKEYKP